MTHKPHDEKFELCERLGLTIRTHANYADFLNVSATELEALLQSASSNTHPTGVTSLELNLKPKDERVYRKEIEALIDAGEFTKYRNILERIIKHGVK